MNQRSFNYQYKYVPFLAMFYVSLALCYPILNNKPVQLPFGILSASTVIIPIWFIMTTIITEIYGFKTIMKLFWSTLICLYTAALIMHVLLNLSPAPHLAVQHSYEYVLGNFLNVTVLVSIALIISTRTNAYFLARCKTLFQGKYFLLRAFVATLTGEFIFTGALMPTGILFKTKIFSKESFVLLAWLMIVETVLTIILVLSSAFFITVLKKMDNVDIYDDQVNFNPFHGFIL